MRRLPVADPAAQGRCPVQARVALRLMWLVLSCSTVAASSPTTVAGSSDESASKIDRSSPVAIATVSGPTPSKLRWQISQAIRLALRHLEESPQCRELFKPLHQDGVELLAQATLQVASSETEVRICRRRSASAFTTVGGQLTVVCPQLFGKLTPQKAAAILIHEALHQAGLEEWPRDPNGLTSQEITTLVRRSCDL